MRAKGNFRPIVHAALATTRVRDLLATHPALIQERIAFGGGAIHWYYCRDTTDLEAVEGRLSPGALVSFYFDDRMRRSPISPKVRAEIESIVERLHGAFVGVVVENEVEMKADVTSGGSDLDYFLSEIEPETPVFWGEHPGTDNDGIRAVTVTLPDEDGVVRHHPY